MKTNSLIASFWLGKELQSNDIARNEEIKATLNKWQSCLSLRVRQLLLFEDESNISLKELVLSDNKNNSSSAICEKGLIKESVFVGLRNDDVPYDTLEAEPFTKASNIIKVIARQISNFFDFNIISTNDFLNLYNDELKWYENYDVYKKCIELYLEEDYFTVLLIVISNLERIFGDIIYSLYNDTSIIPSLLRDILIAPSLVSLFGEDMIFFLRCVIGPPSSMNLRNVIWHGFINPHEFLPIPAKLYCAFMLTVTMNVCNIVRNKGVIVLLKKRNGMSLDGYYYLTQRVDKTDDMHTYDSIKEDFAQIYERLMYGHAIPPQGSHLLILETLLFRNFFVISQSHSAWLRSFHHLSNDQVLLSFILILPLLEHCLRRIYVCVNNVQYHRMSTMEVGEYFLTLDIILEEKVDWAFFGVEEEKKDEEQMNEIYSEFGGSIMDLLLDLFVHADGPRLRDRVAHGETNHLVSSESFNLSNPLCNYFLGLLIVLWNKYKINIPLTHQGDNIIKGDCQSSTTSEIKLYESWISNYRSRFHPIPMLWKESVRMITNVWKCWNVYREMTKTGRFMMGNWIEPFRVMKSDTPEDSSLFDQGFLQNIVEVANIFKVVQECCTRLNKRKLGGTKHVDDNSIYWSQIKFTKDDAKVINFRRGVIKKANAGVEKLHSILITLHSSNSLSSRKRKNTQSLFNLFPSMFQQLYFALLTLEQTRNQKSMLSKLVFVERWNGFCVEGNWKDINGAFEELLNHSKTDD
ncbi:8628_t:CDS:2 [Funneliformis geosporum]|uniref:4336_t:CDS:1 n=1 Tax=Funneliformis geosporum TaxID=1117311 RepID=A0A9W4SJB1_9GLOM|nr:8628_t:CDS:2 [Funneliformis geosporum]CAI2169078.1 4336_t:CDS:2 [Funneliformis geosporum]